MSLSVCLITRNEEGRLERALRSIESVADEIIVTDTGSTDRTLEIAEQFGARINHFTWCDDFAAARNCCFKQAACDWIFWLDADEELLPDSIDGLRRCLARPDVFAYWILRQDITEVSRPDVYSEMWLDRLFRNHPDLRHIGRCHSQFQPPLSELAAAQGQTVQASDIRIRHDGYAGPMRKAKWQRGVRLLELELHDRPGQLYYQIELYRALMLLKDVNAQQALATAAENLFQYKDDPHPPTPLSALLIETLLQLPPTQLPAGWTTPQLRELTQRWFPHAAPLIWILAKQDYEQGDYTQAETRLRQLLEMGQGHSYDRSVGFDPRILGDETRLNLAVCLIRQAKLDEAEELLQSLHSSKDHRHAAGQNLQAIKKLRRLAPVSRRKRKR